MVAVGPVSPSVGRGPQGAAGSVKLVAAVSKWQFHSDRWYPASITLLNRSPMRIQRRWILETRVRRTMASLRTAPRRPLRLKISRISTGIKRPRGASFLRPSMNLSNLQAAAGGAVSPSVGRGPQGAAVATLVATRAYSKKHSASRRDRDPCIPRPSGLSYG